MPPIPTLAFAIKHMKSRKSTLAATRQYGIYAATTAKIKLPVMTATSQILYRRGIAAGASLFSLWFRTEAKGNYFILAKYRDLLTNQLLIHLLTLQFIGGDTILTIGLYSRLVLLFIMGVNVL